MLVAILNSDVIIVFLHATLRVTGIDQALSFVFRKYLRLVSTHVVYETISNESLIDG